MTGSEAPSIHDLLTLDRDIGERVRRLREGRNWTQARLAGEVGGWVAGAGSQSTIAKLEAGSRSPRVSELYALAKIFDKPADELLGLRPPKPANPTVLARELLTALEGLERSNRFYYI